MPMPTTDYDDAVNFPMDLHWLGAMIGSDTRLEFPNFIQGEVYITVRDDSRYNSKVEVDFKNIFNHSTQQRYPDLEWASSIPQSGWWIYLTLVKDIRQATCASLFSSRHHGPEWRRDCWQLRP